MDGLSENVAETRKSSEIIYGLQDLIRQKKLGEFYLPQNKFQRFFINFITFMDR